MEEIDLKELFSYFWNKKLIIIVLTVLALGGGILYSMKIQKPMYKSYTTILLTKEDNNSTITSNDISLNRNLVDTYREIIKSRNVLGKVITNLNLDCTIDELMKKVTVENINDTEIIKISVVDYQEWNSMKIADEIAKVFNTEVVKLYNIQNIGIIDTAELPTKPYNINHVKTAALTGAVGLVVGLGIVFVLFYFDTTIKSSEEVERKLGLPVIGTIPVRGGK
jgi:capsular polysaccharide biosynthesis protein